MIDPKTIKWEELGFGYIECAYRYVSKFKDGKWDDGALVTDSNIVLNECACVFQYSQSCFEGLKAYYTKNGDIVCFRPDMNAERMYDSALRLEMPPFPKDKFVEACEKVIAANKDFVPPYGTGASLYLRPFMFGSNPVIGVKPADEYEFRILVTPVGPYFKGGAKPITIKVSDFDRAAPNGTGHIKAGGGANFIFITKDGTLVTPKSDSILPSITRRSICYVAEKYLGMKVEHREVFFDEVKDFAECGLCGTAAVVSPVGKIYDHGKEICFPSGMEEMGPWTKKIYDTLTGIQRCEIEAPEGWIKVIK